MKSSVQDKKRELSERRKVLEAELQKIDVQLQVLNEIEETPVPHVDQGQFQNLVVELLGMPDVGIGQAFEEGMKALVRFTKPDLVAWVQQKYPELEFSPKSMARPLKDMMDRGNVIVIKQNRGNKTPAVYEFKPNKNGAN